MCIFAVLLVNKYLSSSELELILINIKRNNNYYYTIKTSFIHIYDIKFGAVPSLFMDIGKMLVLSLF